MRTRTVKRGNGAAIGIPAPVMRAARLDIGQEVEIREVDGQIVSDPMRITHYNLAELVDRFTPDNRHDAIDFGNAVGREVR